MIIDLNQIWKELRLPLGLTLLFSALLGLMGLSLDEIVRIAGTLVGFASALALLLDVLKYSGAMPDGWAGVISAIANLLILFGVAALLKFYPTFDFASADAQVAEFVKAAAVVFAYIIQIVGSKGVHNTLVQGFGIKAFRHSAG